MPNQQDDKERNGYTNIYKIEYPDLTAFENKEDNSALCRELSQIANSICDRITKDITKTILSLYPSIADKFKSQDKNETNKLETIISELVKNSIDSVNSAKVKNKEISKIEIKLTLLEQDEKLKIKIKDNGSGFINFKKPHKVELGDFLDPNPMLSGFSIFQLPSKSEEKQTGKSFLLGGQRVGLKNINEIVKDAEGEINIKNRKGEGASIEIELPYSPSSTMKNSNSHVIREINIDPNEEELGEENLEDFLASDEEPSNEKILDVFVKEKVVDQKIKESDEESEEENEIPPAPLKTKFSDYSPKK